MSVAAAYFSIYAYQELKEQLESIDELRFIFISPTFVTEKTSKAQREFTFPAFQENVACMEPNLK